MPDPTTPGASKSDPDALKKVTDFLDQLAKEGISATDFISPPETSVPEGNLAGCNDSTSDVTNPPSLASTNSGHTPTGMLSLHSANCALPSHTSQSHRSANLGWQLKGYGGRGY